MLEVMTTTSQIKTKIERAERRLTTVRAVTNDREALNLRTALTDLSRALTDLLGEVDKLRQEVADLKKGR